jgi:hypothetical protein
MTFVGTLSQSDLQAILALKALEEARPDPPSPELRKLAGSEAGDPAEREPWLARRAAYILERLPRKYRSLAGVQVPPGWLALPLALVAFGFGMATNTLGPTGKIHAFYNPTTLIIVWNGIAIALIAARHFAPQRASGQLSAGFAAFLALAARGWRRVRGAEDAPGGDFAIRAALIGEHQKTFSEAIVARAAVLLSAGSLAFTSGVLVGMYLRGVAFGYNVVWQSTLVQTPEAALAWLEVLFLPARWLTPGSFPSPAAVAQLASPDGTPAGPWIHCFAATAFVYALLPRSAVICWQQWSAQCAAARAELDLSEPYFEQLFRGGRPAASDFDRVALAGFALDANQYAVLASLQAGLIEADLRSRARRSFALRDTLPKRNRWYPQWKRVVEDGWRDAFPEADRPRLLKLDSPDFQAALARTKRSANPFATQLIALELAAFEAYWPLEPASNSWLRAFGAGGLPRLADAARVEFHAEAAARLGLPVGFVSELRRDLKATARELERFWLHVGLRVVPGVAVGTLTLGIAAPFIGGLVGGAMGLGGAVAVKAGLAALGGGALAAHGLGMAGGTSVLVGGGALLGGLGAGALALRHDAGFARGLSPEQATLSAVKIEVFLRSVMLPRDPAIFRRVVERFEAAVAEFEDLLRDLPTREGVSRKEVERHEKAVEILRRALARIERLAPEA